MLNEHEMRRTVVGEMHLRRWPMVQANCMILQIVSIVERDERDAEQAALRDLPGDAEILHNPNQRHLSGRFAQGISFNWERHSEASSLTIFAEGEYTDKDMPQADAEGDNVARALHWALGLPGKVIRATRIIVLKDEKRCERLAPAFNFERADLVSCHIGCEGGGKRARIWSDFRLRQSGFGLVLVAANGMEPGDLSRTIQRLQELGNYRNLALLGLPVAQHGWAIHDHIEAQLGEVTQRITDPDVTDDALLEEVTGLSIELASEASGSDFRMSATEAYAAIVAERIVDLCISAIEGYQSLSDFIQRRLYPAVRTCAAHRRRSERLAQRTAQFISLFRTRIETRIENQNARLLGSMEKSAVRQLRLQQLVEGFSVVALTYYGMSLIHYMLEGVEEIGGHIPMGLVIAILTPIVAVTIWLSIHRRKKQILG